MKEIKRIKEKKEEEIKRIKEEKEKKVVNLEIEFIKPLDDVKIQGRTITLTEDWKYRTVFINKIINSGIIKMFISFSL
jgi:hypothetical protein